MVGWKPRGKYPCVLALVLAFALLLARFFVKPFRIGSFTRPHLDAINNISANFSTHQQMHLKEPCREDNSLSTSVAFPPFPMGLDFPSVGYAKGERATKRSLRYLYCRGG